MSINKTDQRFMRMALALARRGLGNTWPNPAVGAVVVQNHNRVIGRGLTAPNGRPHAEPQALQHAGAGAKGATLYVTLEPCSHHGQTPPCTDAIINAGIKRVVCASHDPNPVVNGQGFAKLRAAGISVTQGVCQAEGDAINQGFFLRITQKRPMITLKLALSLDGKIATHNQDSQWITGVAARHYVHYLRATHDAVMVGRATAVADDPTLNIRGFGDAIRQPVRLVMDTKLQTPSNSKLGQAAQSGHPVWLCHGPDANVAHWAATGANTIPCALDQGHISLKDALKQLAKQGLTRILCEGGGKLAASLLRAGMVDHLMIFQGGVAIGADGIDGLGPLRQPILADCPRFKRVQQRILGDDTLSVWAPV